MCYHWQMKKTLGWYTKKYGDKIGAVTFNFRQQSKELPWEKAYKNILYRCSQSTAREFSDYGGRGIKCEIKSSDLKVLFFRDNGHLMKTASVDRIDPEGSYTKSNIRWIEFDTNRRWNKMSHPVRARQCQEIFEIISSKQKEFRWHNKLVKACLRKLVKMF